MTKPKINIANLIIEVTRRCDMSCAHCLRGDEQNLDITAKTVALLLDQCNTISSITFTGGEPSLNVPIIQHILTMLKDRDIKLQSFYIVTNGKKYNQELVDTLNDYYTYCLHNNLPVADTYIDYKNIPTIDTDDFTGGLCVSFDAYHERILYANYMKYMTLPYYRKDKEFTTKRPQRIIDRGNANLNGIGEIVNRVSELDIYYESDNKSTGTNYTIDELYLSADGNILADCDLSYYEQDDYSYGNINNQSLITILEAQL